MAILNSLLGVEVTVWAEGSQLQEYDDENDRVKQTWKHKTTSKFIESKADTDFFLKFKVGAPYEHDCDELGFAVIVDGEEENVDSHLCNKFNLEDGGEWEYDVHGVESQDVDGAKLMRFRFSPFHTTDNEALQISENALEGMQMIGQIEVRVHQLSHCKRKKKKMQPKNERRRIGVVPEKIFKGQAISHSISYESEEKLSEPSHYLGTKYMHGWNYPIGIFRFKYRSRSDLQKECIIDRTPTPEPPKPLRVDELTPEQKNRLARMRFDDIEMLRSLTSAPSNASGQRSVHSHRRFEDLTSEEIDQLVIEKHGEMTSNPVIKADPGVVVKQEPSSETTNTATSPKARGRSPFLGISMAGQKHVIDLTASDGEDEDENNEQTSSPVKLPSSSQSESSSAASFSHSSFYPSSQGHSSLDEAGQKERKKPANVRKVSNKHQKPRKQKRRN